MRYAIIGGAGFIGSHFVDALLATDPSNEIVVVDNFSSGTRGHLIQHSGNPRLRILEEDALNTVELSRILVGVEKLILLASNPDIARAVTEPRIDFDQGTRIVESTVEASRIAGVKRIIFASGSGVYGEVGDTLLAETSPLNPISTYGASKIAGETLLTAYSYMFGIEALIFRFANVVGSRQTHGVGFDFIKRLTADPTHLRVLGDGFQSKSYIHVSDVVSAVLLMDRITSKPIDCFNVSTTDRITVNEIADLAIQCLNLELKSVNIQRTGGDRGWNGDVPLVILDSKKIRDLGWTPSMNSAEAMKSALTSMAGLIN